MTRRCCPRRIHFRRMLAISAAFLGMGLAASAVTAASEELAKPGLIVPGSPKEARFNAPGGIALNPTTGEIILANTNEHRIEIYSLGGRFLTRFAHRVRVKDGTLVEGLPRSIAVAGANRLLVVDSYAPYVDVIDYRGSSVAELKTPVPPNGPGLTSVAVTRKGEILASAPGEMGRIYFFAPDFTPIGSWGEPGKSPGHLNNIVAMAELPDGNIVVACALTELAIQIFTPQGEFVGGFGNHDIGPGNFSLPSGLAVTADGRIWASDELRQIVQVFNSTGTYIGAVGGGGVAPGCFQYPSALATDGVSHLAVTERVGGRFQIFNIPSRSDDSEPEANLSTSGSRDVGP